jgi:glucose-1-phosphate adenylyltransferase
VERVITIVLAGGSGDRLQPLTQARSKPAVPFAGKFRLIDFPLSNCLNSGIRKILVLTQYKSWSLQKHIQEGWGISISRLGEFIYCVPAQQKVGQEWYQGTADAIRQNLDILTRNGFDDVLILSGDHVYKMNYAQLVQQHRAWKAPLTVSAIRVNKELAAGSLGVFEVDDSSRAISFEEKPLQPKTISSDSDDVLASMGIYIFKTDFLLKALKLDGDDFGKHIIPQVVNQRRDIFVYDYTEKNKIEDFVTYVKGGRREHVLVDRTDDSSYWRDVGTIDTYYEASMDLINVEPVFNLYGDNWSFRTYERSLPPSKCVIGGRTFESMISDGCIISGGLVQKSILSPGVIVEKDAVVEDSVVFDQVIIEPGARVRRAIIDKEVSIRAGISIGYDLEADTMRGCTVSENRVVVVPRGMDVA